VAEIRRAAVEADGHDTGTGLSVVMLLLNNPAKTKDCPPEGRRLDESAWPVPDKAGLHPAPRPEAPPLDSAKRRVLGTHPFSNWDCKGSAFAGGPGGDATGRVSGQSPEFFCFNRLPCRMGRNAYRVDRDRTMIIEESAAPSGLPGARWLLHTRFGDYAALVAAASAVRRGIPAISRRMPSGSRPKENLRKDKREVIDHECQSSNTYRLVPP
jgi:hypothetical protein